MYFGIVFFVMRVRIKNRHTLDIQVMFVHCRDMLNLLSGAGNMKLTTKRRDLEISIGRSCSFALKSTKLPPVRVLYLLCHSYEGAVFSGKLRQLILHLPMRNSPRFGCHLV
jgi:hypothetical protein